jgi:hypothetical protein
MTDEEFRAALRRFATDLANAMSAAESAARDENGEGMIKALGAAKTAANELARKL